MLDMPPVCLHIQLSLKSVYTVGYGSRTNTLPPSTCLVSITIVAGLCSQTILQKSQMVPDMGPWAAM